MGVRCVVLDFDGTFTDAEAEAEPFVAAFRAALADLLGRPIDEPWARALAAIEADPGRHGWEFGGRIVAPATADPYILSTTVAQAVTQDAGILRDAATRSAVIESLYQLAYLKTRTVFREEAREVLETILSKGLPTFVITNSRTDAVARKIDTLAPRGRERIVVLGDAKKFAIGDPEGGSAVWGDIPAERTLEGLPRPVLLHRGRYWNALQHAVDAAKCELRNVLVCGDIFELDLALPVALGARVHLVTGPRTPPYEAAEIVRLGERASAGTLGDVLSRLA
jgi:phosphoglycolate phosphatase-like HAD superfamily hydrolase